ncbi:MAG: hypothetical protein OHK93_007541 [Ramalina farinacea]|uniref:Uncharacterized protein n=1 Tax=Ramalina farinacea TaxID=258253 RepID=A0AA43TXP4_9LECA|nr:hypothetical protein [Ramalina farinacea]
MGYEISIIAGYTTFLLVVFTAWVGGYLDPLQHSLQDIILGKMGDNRVSYGAKSLMSQRVVEDKNVTAVQDGVSQGVGGVVGKGGIAEDIGNTLSKGL